MEFKVNGLVLKAVEYQEKDKLVTLSTLEKGKLLVSAKGVRGDKAKLKLAASPLCFGEYILTESRGKLIITGCTVISVFYDCWKNPDKYLSAMILIETLDKLAPEGVYFPELTLETVKGLTKIEEGKLYPPAIALNTVLNLITFSGFLAPEYFFEDNTEAKSLFSSMRLELSDMEALELSEADIKRAFRLLYSYFAGHLELKLNSVMSYLKE